jgi:hypothetical protein
LIDVTGQAIREEQPSNKDIKCMGMVQVPEQRIALLSQGMVKGTGQGFWI